MNEHKDEIIALDLNEEVRIFIRKRLKTFGLEHPYCKFKINCWVDDLVIDSAKEINDYLTGNECPSVLKTGGDKVKQSLSATKCSPFVILWPMELHVPVKRSNFASKSDKYGKGTIDNRGAVGATADPADGYGTFMTTAEISDKLVIKGSIKRPMPLNRLGMILRKAGFQSKMVGAARTRGWIVRERDMEEVQANRNIEGRS